MSTLATFLIGIAGSLAARVLLALGISIVSYASLITVTDSLISQMQTNFNSLPATTLQLAKLGGVGTFLAIVTSAFVARVALLAVKRFKIT